MAHEYRDIPAAGTSLYIETGYGEQLIEGLTELNWEGIERGVREATPLSATAVRKKPGMMNWGQITGTMYYDPNDTTHKLVRDRLKLSAAAQGAALDTFKYEFGGDGFATPSFAEVEGFVSTFSISASDPETGTVEAELTIEVTGEPTFTDGSPAE